jgi:dTDP-4-amino-4,6-dideoxygalactose transaminase
LRRQYDGIREEVLDAISRVCDSQSFILGPEVEALEREIAALTGAAAPSGARPEPRRSGSRSSPPA